MSPTSSIVGFCAFLFNLGAVLVLSTMLPFGMHVSVWAKLLLAFLITTGETLAATAAIYAVREAKSQPARKVTKSPDHN